MRNRLFKLSLISLAIGITVLGIAFFFFHFVTDTGVTLTWQSEAGKPFVTLLIGIFGVEMIGVSALSLLSALILFPKDKNGGTDITK